MTNLNSLLQKQKGNELFSQFANIPVGERAKWLENLVNKSQTDLLKGIVDGLEGMKTNFDVNGEDKMCWKCSYWGNDCKCYHNQVLSDAQEFIKNIIKE